LIIIMKMGKVGSNMLLGKGSCTCAILL